MPDAATVIFRLWSTMAQSIPDKENIKPDTPLRLSVAAALASPDD